MFSVHKSHHIFQITHYRLTSHSSFIAISFIHCSTFSSSSMIFILWLTKRKGILLFYEHWISIDRSRYVCESAFMNFESKWWLNFEKWICSMRTLNVMATNAVWSLISVKYYTSINPIQILNIMTWKPIHKWTIDLLVSIETKMSIAG